MSADTRIIVKVVVLQEQEREVFAITLDEAVHLAMGLPEVYDVLSARYPEEGE